MRGLMANKFLLKNDKVIRALTLTDFSVWSGSSLITVIFPIFIITQIPGATVTDAGIASMIYMIVPALLNLPIGKLLDRKKGYVDELAVLIASNIIRGVAIILMAFSSSIWMLFGLQFILGVAKSMNVTSWRVLFSKFLDQNHLGNEWGLYDTIMSVGLGIAAFLGGYLGENIGYQLVIIIGGVMSLIGTIFPLFTYRTVKKVE